jgi:hypothetical protein
MGDIVDGLNALMKGYQLELNFDDNKEDELELEQNVIDNSSNTSITHRGSKEFIQHMTQVTEQGDLFEDEKMEGE